MSQIVIPYQVEPHPLTGVTSGKLGIWLFLASEVMLFGEIFSSYVLIRVGAPEATWPTGVEAGLNVPIGTLNTIVLITSSITMVMSWASPTRGWSPSRGCRPSSPRSVGSRRC